VGNPESRTEIRRADPSLRERPSKDPLRPFGVPKWIGVLLYALFWFLLLVPLVRRWRRREDWNRVRFTIGLGALGLLAWGVSTSYWWVAAVAAAALLSAAALGPAYDPERERKLQRLHQADYLLNGGALVAANLPGDPLPRGIPLYLMLRREELLVVPRDRAEHVQWAIAIRQVERILVNGEIYRPVYVSEAKDPPVREDSVDQAAISTLELGLEGGNRLRVEYVGAFGKHLAETAAHAVHSVRQLAHGVTGQSPEVFHVIGR
jgi:hypothetical protein